MPIASAACPFRFSRFDLPDQNVSCGRRNVSTVCVKEAGPNDPAKQIETAFRIALKRPPDEKKMAAGMDFLKKQSLADFTHMLLNLNEFLYVR